MQLSNTPKPAFVPYWNEVKRLSKKDKIQLITLLSSSLLEFEERYAEEPVSEKNVREQELLSSLPSAWRKLYGSASSLNNYSDPDDERFNYLMEKYK